jgi:TRAP-type uncharacterized transport system substrate-binding protein
MVGREFVRAPWPLIAAIVAAVAILGAAVMLLSTMPPRTTTMATGPEGGAYYEAGRLYQAILAREGVELRLVSTGGALENAALLGDPRSGVSVALVEGGSIRENGTSQLESLGTLFYEPLWIFYRAALRPLELDGLRGLKVSVGPEGSGTRALSLEILKRSGIDQQVGTLLSLSPRTAGEKLLAG